MLDVHYNAITRQIYIDEGMKSTTIDIPAGLDATEIAYVLHSDTLKAIISALIEGGKE